MSALDALQHKWMKIWRRLTTTCRKVPAVSSRKLQIFKMEQSIPGGSASWGIWCNHGGVLVWRQNVWINYRLIIVVQGCHGNVSPQLDPALWRRRRLSIYWAICWNQFQYWKKQQSLARHDM